MRWIKQSLRRQLILLMFLSLTIPITLSIFINYQSTKDFLYSQANEETRGLLSKGGEEIASYIDSINRASLSIYTDEDFYQTLAGRTSVIGNDFYYNRLYAISRLIKETRQVYVYSAANDTSFLMVNGVFKKASGPSPLMIGNVKPYAFALQGVHDSEAYIRQAPYNGKTPVFTLQRPFYRVPSNVNIGFLAIDIDPDEFDRIFRELNGKLSGDLFLYDEHGDVFYKSKSSNVGKTFHDSVTRRIFDQSANSGAFSLNEDSFSGIVFFQKVLFADHPLVLAKRISANILYQQAHRLALINSLIAILCLAVAFGAILLVSLNITSPVLRLIRHINRIQTGQFNASIRLERQDEIGLLARQFQTMMDTINDLIRNEYKIKLANQLSELKALQAQINPHFLNNVLQSIGSVALEAHVPKVYALISSLGQMMYYNMNNKEIIVTLEQEAEYLRHYLNLQMHRYQNQFLFAIHIDPHTKHLPILKMTLQPVVENYFKHNLLIEGGVLSMQSHLVGDTLQLIVEDNGTGITDLRLKQLENYLNSENETGGTSEANIGLRNVIERLRYYYGPQARIRLRPADPRGLAVTLIIPIIPTREDLYEGTYRR